MLKNFNHFTRTINGQEYTFEIGELIVKNWQVELHFIRNKSIHKYAIIINKFITMDAELLFLIKLEQYNKWNYECIFCKYIRRYKSNIQIST